MRRRIKALRAALPAALEGDPAALHRARVASRRLRELLPLLPDAPRATRRRVRRLTRLLGRVREMDVALALLAAEERHEGVSRLALVEAWQHVRGARETLRGAMMRRLHKLNLKKLDRRVDDLVPAAAATDAAVLRRRLAPRLTRRAAALRDAVDAAGAIYAPERLHAVRIAAKKTRYALEIAAELGTRDAARLAAIVRRAQVTLGDLQDRNVLLREVHDAASRAPEASQHALLALASSLEQSGRELHGQFLAQRAAIAAACAAVRRDIVPDLARAARRKAPLRAALSRGREEAVRARR